MASARSRRIVWGVAVLAALLVLPVLDVGSLLGLLYLHASDTLHVEGKVEQVLTVYYSPLVQYVNSDLPGAGTLNDTIGEVIEAGERRSREKQETR